MAQKNIYNLLNGEKGYLDAVLAADGVTSSNNASDSTNQNTQITPPEADNASKSEVRTELKGKKKKKSIDFKNLEGDLEITPTPKNFRIVPGMTVKIVGIGKFLSGFYFVMSRSTSISGNSPMSIKLSVVKTQFGRDLKGDILETIQTEDLIGDKDKKGKSGKSSGKISSAVDDIDKYPPSITTNNNNNTNTSGGDKPYHVEAG